VILLLVHMGGWLFFPDDHLGLVKGELGKHLARTVYTNSQNAIVLAWWIGALVVAAVQKDRSTLTAGTLIGGGFGIGFTLAALWCLGYRCAPSFIDWWKIWELNAGFNLGLLYVAVLYWAISQIDKINAPKGAPRATADASTEPSSFAQWCETLSLALAVLLVVYVMGRAHFPTTGILLGLVYVVALCLATRQTDGARDPLGVTQRRRNISITYSAFLLLFVMAWGASSQMGILLELYKAQDVDQYEWPWARKALFAPAGILIVGVALLRMWRIVSGPRGMPQSGPAAARISLYLVDLMTVTGVVGAVSIWPAKIGVLYAVFLSLALFSFNRFNRRFDQLDVSRQQSE
jgi:hypothetical protein